MDMFSLIGGGANVGLELMNNIANNDKMKRLRSKQNDMMFGKVQGALDQNQSNRAGLQGSYRQQRADLQEADKTVNALASGGASQYANTNAGGDVTSGASAGANIAKASSGAAMQQAGQMAGTNQTLQQNLAQNTAQEGNLAMTGAQIEDMNPWYQDQSGSLGQNLMSALTSGSKAGIDLKDYWQSKSMGYDDTKMQPLEVGADGEFAIDENGKIIPISKSKQFMPQGMSAGQPIMMPDELLRQQLFGG